MESNLKLYKVSFTFDDSYTPKVECFRSISLVVEATTQFAALDTAWYRISRVHPSSSFGLDLPEPKEFNAQRVTKDC